MSKWISVKERLPEEAGSYFVWNPARPARDALAMCLYTPMAGWYSFEADKITHWMPMPEPPEGVPGVKIDSRLRYDLARVLEKECEIEVTGCDAENLSEYGAGAAGGGQR